ncbi:GDYXXLXY domain-containing protein [Tianweitania sediminis]|uniref:GDYXXLXY domain-containing protein n=1 Tax=Tianweitania sediminis TaxID=1502156 RepID=A0A8J7RPV5_9HYPH|nr:GDYXXLXY domain-containing protein [Tianweitania sediminis]MBP0439824.1 GDYXXLXY domain-containing protein [Tianweitania sediminis]
MNGRKLLVAAVVVAVGQVAFLAAMIQGRAALLRDGREVVLRTQPVDPRDLLRGDYVALSYDISRVASTLVQSPRPRDDQPLGAVAVRLQQGEALQPAQIVAVFAGQAPGPAAEGQIDLAGESDTRWSANVEEIMISYGLERFYLPEGEGRAVERGMRERTFKMVVAVGEGGQAQIKRFYDGETPIYQEPLY